MKIYSKKEIFKIIEENMSDVDEMAYRQKGIQSTRTVKKTGEIEYRQCIPLWADDNPAPIGSMKGIPDAWLVNVEQKEGGDVLCVPLDCDDIQEFMLRKKDFLEKLKVTHRLEPQIMRCGTRSVRPTDHVPVLGAFGITKGNSENTLSFKTWANTKLYPILRGVFDNEQVRKRLEELSLPPIAVSDRSHLDSYGETNQTKIEYTTHTFNSYDSQQDFLEAVEARIFGEDKVLDTLKTYYLARQYNQKYRKWLETIATDAEYKGKTSIYKLDAYGTKDGNSEVTVRADLKIIGNVVNDNFVWTIQYVTKFGKKLKDERRIKNGLELDKDLIVTKTLPVGEYLRKLVDPSEEGKKLKAGDDRIYTLFNVPEVTDSLKDALVEMREKLFTELDPVEVLEKANIRSYDVAESKLKTKITESILKSMKSRLRK